jgi:hypothetical protein
MEVRLSDRRFSRRIHLAIPLLLGLVPALWAQRPQLQIIVERKLGKSVQQMSPQHVFAAGNRVRFRFRSSFDGYLYVMDQSTSGKYVMLFPDAAETSNRVTRDKEYLVPASSGSWFRVDDPAGYEIIYFLISPKELKKNPGKDIAPDMPKLTPPPVDPSSELLPRCDDAIFRSRGDCVDVLAGPRSVPQSDAIPRELTETPPTGSRDVTIINKPTSSVIAPAGDDQAAPIIYQFRLAHH